MSIIKDARRYQYLRDHVGSVWAESIGSAEECDAAVDAMLAERADHEAPPPSVGALARAIQLLSGEMAAGRLATLHLRWTEGAPYAVDGFEACDPVYPLTVVLEIVE